MYTNKKKRDEIVFNIKMNILELQKLYDGNITQITFNIPPNCVLPEKIKTEIKEIV